MAPLDVLTVGAELIKTNLIKINLNPYIHKMCVIKVYFLKLDCKLFDKSAIRHLPTSLIELY